VLALSRSWIFAKEHALKALVTHLLPKRYTWFRISTISGQCGQSFSFYAQWVWSHRLSDATVVLSNCLRDMQYLYVPQDMAHQDTGHDYGGKARKEVKGPLFPGAPFWKVSRAQ
jgi:hypothetical protein